MKTVLRLAVASLVAATATATLLAQGGPRGPVDLSGEWAPLFHEDQPERIPGPEIGDYSACRSPTPRACAPIPGTRRILTLPEHQCKPHPADYSPRGPANLRIWDEMDHGDAAARRDPHAHLLAGSPSARSGWTAVRIRRNTRRTPGRDSRPASGTATCSPSRPRT